MDLKITGGKIVGPDNVYQGNIYIKDGVIAAITTDKADMAAAAVIDAKGHYIFPGGIDPHVHFNDPGYNWRETFLNGTRAAAAGGITTIIDMPLQNEPNVTDGDIYRKKEAAVGPDAYVDYCLWGGFVNNNIDKFDGMAEAGARYFKAFISGAGRFPIR